METFSWPVRVYYEDTDCGGVVYYANYLRFMERARTEWLRSLGVEQDRLKEQEGILFAVRHVTLDYLKPARFNDHLEVISRVTEHGRASLTFEQTITRLDGETRTELCCGQVKVACLTADSFRPCPIPEYLRMEIC
jgi:acyl-CoA thioester hydrolase